MMIKVRLDIIHMCYALCVMSQHITNIFVATVLNLVCHDAVSSIPTIDEPGESVGTVTFNNAGTVQTQSHREFCQHILSRTIISILTRHSW